MNDPITYILIAVSIVSCISFIGLFLVPGRLLRVQSLLFFLISVAVGALLGDAFIHLLPESFEKLGGLNAGFWVLGGLGIFFVFEKFLHWHHHHELHTVPREDCEDCEEHIAPFGKLIIAADTLHNITDGAIIAAGFFISFEAGIATTIAVALHEIPHEAGNFGALLHAGFSRMRALLLNFASALSAFFGVIAVIIIGNSFENVVPIISALTVGGFIYIAVADLVPELHKTTHLKDSLIQFLAIIFGVMLMFGLLMFEH